MTLMICEFLTCFGWFQDNNEIPDTPNNPLLRNVRDILFGINLNYTTDSAIETIIKLLVPTIENLDLTAIPASKQEIQIIKAFFDATVQKLNDLQMDQVQDCIKHFQDEFNNLIMEVNAYQLAIAFYPIIDLQKQAQNDPAQEKHFNAFVRQWVEKFFLRLELHFGYPLNIDFLIELLLEKTQRHFRELQEEDFQAAPANINNPTQSPQDELSGLLEESIDQLSPEELMRDCIITVQIRNRLKVQQERNINLALSPYRL